MPKQVRLRRGTTAQHATFTGAEGEVTFDTTRKALVVHDGVTVGGKPLDGLVKLDPGLPLSVQEIKTIVVLSGGDEDNFGLNVKNALIANEFAAQTSCSVKRLVLLHQQLIYAAAMTLDFTGYGSIAIPLGGNVSFSTSGVSSGRLLVARILCDATLRTLTWPAFKWVGGTAPANIAANKSGLLRLHCFGVTDADVIAQWAVEL